MNLKSSTNKLGKYTMIKKNTQRTEKIVLDTIKEIGSPKDSVWYLITRIKHNEKIIKSSVNNEPKE